MVKVKSLKRKLINEPKVENEEIIIPPATRSSDEPIPKKVKWINKQRVLVFACRGINHRGRHLMTDLRSLMPHSKSESKMERRENLQVVNELCEMKNCNKCVLFEGRLKRDLYLWISNVPNGPSAKFLLENMHTMAELRMTGNCLKGSRPLLSFDENFNSSKPHYNLLKELLTQIFGVPNKHPKSQPFFDHVMTFSVLDNRIWFRNFQILSEDGALAEIGPRFVLNPIKIFDGSFGGQTLWENPFYVSPAKYRQQLVRSAAGKYLNRVHQKLAYEESRPKELYQIGPTDELFSGDTLEKAKEIVGVTEEIDTDKHSVVQNKPKVKKSKKQLQKKKRKRMGVKV